jgi:hypothetical protein
MPIPILELLPPSKKEQHFRVVLSQTFSTLTKFAEKNINVYEIK